VDIAAWLRELGLERYEEAFRENEIDAEILPKLTADDLKDIGVTAVGHRRKLLEAVAALAEPASASQAARSAPAEAASRVRPAEAERRQLTVLFCDLVGSTELSARLDPEEMREVMRAYQIAVAGEVATFEGHVAKFMGDGVLAFFGYPKAHEDDAERAVRAGLAITGRIGDLSTGGRKLTARIGIATGPVVVGDLIGEGAAQEEAVVGETPNLAARLQTLAEPDSVVIAPGTRRLIGGLFELADFGVHGLKGFAEPVRAWRVVGAGAAESRFEALRGRHLIPLVGREEELHLLLARWRRAADGEGQIVLLSGEAGIGKSRIVQALREQLAGQPYTPLSHYCSPYHTASALYPIISLLERAACFTRDDSPEARLDKLESLLAQGTEQLAETVPLIADVLGIAAGERHPSPNLSPQRKAQRTLEVLVDQVEGLASRQPVLALYEDVHWIDPTTLAALGLLIERVQRLPVLVLLTFRPEFVPPWSGHAHVTHLSLARLTRRHGTAIVARLAAGKALPEKVLDEIVARTDGIPLFVEELTKAVLESGLLKEAGDHYELAGPLPPLAIPCTLQDSLMARLDRLAPVKEVAQIGAVIGREFGHQLLTAVLPSPEKRLNDALDQLVASELVFRRGTPPEATYSFKHALVQEAAYNSLLKSRRQQLHGRIASVMEQRFPDIANTQPELVAHHYTEAGCHEPAITYWQQASDRALQHWANQEAIGHLTRALALLSTQPDTIERWQRELALQAALGVPLMAVKGYADPDVEHTYARALELYRQVGDSPELDRVLPGLFLYCLNRSELNTAAEVGEQLLNLADRQQAPLLCFEAHFAVGSAALWRGEFATAQQHFERSDALSTTLPHGAQLLRGVQDSTKAYLSVAPLSLWMLGYPDQAVQKDQEARSRPMRWGILSAWRGHSSLLRACISCAASGRRSKRTQRQRTVSPLSMASSSGWLVASSTKAKYWWQRGIKPRALRASARASPPGATPGPCW
jgi:class 3 adenylate cyclase/tetratricopeptide (TPR) repeat protein